MTRKQQWMLVGGIVSLAILIVVFASVTMRDQLFPVSGGSKAPDFSAATLDSPAVTRTLADYKGDVILLNFWATWCEPCKVEMPSMEQLHREYRGRGLRVVAVSQDAAGSENTIRKFVADHGLTFEILHDPHDSVGTAYRTRGVPETFIVDRSGTITVKRWAPDDWFSPANRAIIEHLLGDTPSANTSEPSRTIPAPDSGGAGR
jgi:cytochrome c biogenesis protein CcmG/thiol:disulfide interchange protein DsbE